MPCPGQERALRPPWSPLETSLPGSGLYPHWEAPKQGGADPPWLPPHPRHGAQSWPSVKASHEWGGREEEAVSGPEGLDHVGC